MLACIRYVRARLGVGALGSERDALLLHLRLDRANLAIVKFADLFCHRLRELCEGSGEGGGESEATTSTAIFK